MGDEDRAATPDDSVMLHASSPPRPNSCPMLPSSAYAASVADDDDDDVSTPLPSTDSLPDADTDSANGRWGAFHLPDNHIEDAPVGTPFPAISRTPSARTLVDAEPSYPPFSPRSSAVPTSSSSFADDSDSAVPTSSSSLELLGIPDAEVADEPESEEPTAPEPLLPNTASKRKERSPEPKSEARSAPPPSPKRQRTETPGRVPAKDKRMSASARDVAASRAKSMKKLATPFRSPLVTVAQRTSAPQTPTPTPSKPGPAFKKPAAVTISRLVRETSDTAVTSPFRPPVPKAQSANQPTVLTVQNLERRLQALKRAIKIKKDGGDNSLERLAVKWRDAARSASWDLYELVRDGAGAGPPAQGGRDSNWGWGDDDRKQFGSDGAWGSDPTAAGEHEDADADEPEAPEKPDPSVGTMLAELGIAPALLGWKEDEGDFLDA